LQELNMTSPADWSISLINMLLPYCHYAHAAVKQKGVAMSKEYMADVLTASGLPPVAATSNR
jgi:hypothetical protein